MRKIVILIGESPSRDALVAQLRLNANAVVVVAMDATEVAEGLREGFCAGVLADISLVGENLPSVLAAVRHASWRPLFLLVTDDPKQDLDPDLISLVLRKPYDVAMVTGILVTAVGDMPPATNDADFVDPPISGRLRPE